MKQTCWQIQLYNHSAMCSMTMCREFSCIRFCSYCDNLIMHITVNRLTDEITTFPRLLFFLLPCYLIIAVYGQELCDYCSSDLHNKYKKNKCYKYISTWFLSLLFVSAGFDCPVCSKFVCSDEIDDHLLMCFSKPRLNYNGKNTFTITH